MAQEGRTTEAIGAISRGKEGVPVAALIYTFPFLRLFSYPFLKAFFKDPYAFLRPF